MNKMIFIDRDGTLVREPSDFQVDRIEKVELMDDVIPALIALNDAGYKLIMISNQDGLGTESFPLIDFKITQAFILKLFATQGIIFDHILICPHFEQDQCDCRKPKLGLVMNYIIERRFDPKNSYVIGDRTSDMQLAQNMNIQGLQLGRTVTWDSITKTILNKPRTARIERNTNETQIDLRVNLDEAGVGTIQSPCNFMNHMLEQIAKHGAMSLSIDAKADIEVDDHHCIEDIAICLGQAIKEALGDKRGLERYGFTTPMDESLATVVIDISGRAECVFNGRFTREQVGDLSTELVPHFFKTLSQNMNATLHISVIGENNHHMVEACFKAFGRALKQAKTQSGSSIASTKGCL